MHGSRVEAIHVRVGDQLLIGARLLDLVVDLSAAAPHDCPPRSHYSLAVRDKVWVRRLDVAPGDEPEVGASLGLFSTEPDEPVDGAPAREIRVAIVGVIPNSTFRLP